MNTFSTPQPESSRQPIDLGSLSDEVTGLTGLAYLVSSKHASLDLRKNVKNRYAGHVLSKLLLPRKDSQLPERVELLEAMQGFSNTEKAYCLGRVATKMLTNSNQIVVLVDLGKSTQLIEQRDSFLQRMTSLEASVIIAAEPDDLSNGQREVSTVKDILAARSDEIPVLSVARSYVELLVVPPITEILADPRVGAFPPAYHQTVQA
jgi:hypothetical protein